MLYSDTGFGVFFYPPSQIYDTDIEKLPRIKEGKRRIVINKKIMPDFRVIVTDDCFICPISKSYKNSIDFLNILFAVFITKFYRAQIMTKSDLCITDWNQKSKYITVNSHFSKSLRSLQESKRCDAYDEWVQIERQEIHKQLMERFLVQSAHFLNNKNFKNNLLVIGESGRMYNDDLFSVSFLSSWIVIESILNTIWDKFIEKATQTNKEKDALKNHSSWSVSHYIETFRFTGKLTPKGYECLTKLRKIRNDIMHNKRRDVSQEQAWNCLSVSIFMVYNQLNQINPFEDVVYKELNKYGSEEK